MANTQSQPATCASAPARRKSARALEEADAGEGIEESEEDPDLEVALGARSRARIHGARAGPRDGADEEARAGGRGAQAAHSHGALAARGERGVEPADALGGAARGDQRVRLMQPEIEPRVLRRALAEGGPLRGGLDVAAAALERPRPRLARRTIVRLAREHDGVHVRRRAEGALALGLRGRAARMERRLGRAARRREVAHEARGRRVALGEEVIGHPRVQRGALIGRQEREGRASHPVVVEVRASVERATRAAHQARLLELAQRLVERAERAAEERRQHRDRRPAVLGHEEREQLALARPRGAELLVEGRGRAAGERAAGHLSEEGPALARARRRSERVLFDRDAELGGGPAHHEGRVLDVERRHLDDLGARRLEPRVREGGLDVAPQHQRDAQGLRRAPEEVAHQRDRVGVGPLEVVHHEQPAAPFRRAVEERRDRIEHLAARARLERLAKPEEALAHPLPRVVDRLRARTEQRERLRRDALRAAGSGSIARVEHAREIVHRRVERVVGEALGGPAGARESDRARALRLAREPREQGRLADAARAREDERPRALLEACGDAALQRFAPDQLDVASRPRAAWAESIERRAIAGLLGHERAGEHVEVGWDRHAELVGLGHLGADVRGEHAGDGAEEGRAAGEDLEERAAERVEIGGRGGRRAADALGREVGGSPGDRAVGGARRELREHAEVEQREGARRPDEDVARLEVAVDDAVRMEERERVEELGQHAGEARRRISVPAVAREVLALDRLHRVVEPSLVRAELVEAHEVRMSEPLDRAKLTFEPEEVERLAALSPLERHRAIEERVVREIHGAHPASPERSVQSVARGDLHDAHIVARKPRPGRAK